MEKQSVYNTSGSRLYYPLPSITSPLEMKEGETDKNVSPSLCTYKMGQCQKYMQEIFGPSSVQMTHLLEICTNNKTLLSQQNTNILLQQKDLNISNECYNIDKNDTLGKDIIEELHISIRNFIKYRNKILDEIDHTYIYKQQHQPIEKALYNATSELDFNAIEFGSICDGIPQYTQSMYLQHLYGFFDTTNRYYIPINIASRFFVEIESSYQPCSYHNRHHAVDVQQMAHLLFSGLPYMRLYNGRKYLLYNTNNTVNNSNLNNETNAFSPLDQLGLLIAAVVHDVGHTNTSNKFHIDAKSPQALLFQNKNILENTHLRIFFSILQKYGSNLFSTFTDNDQEYLYKQITEQVLATDLSDNKNHLNQINLVINELKDTLKNTNINNSNLLQDITNNHPHIPQQRNWEQSNTLLPDRQRIELLKQIVKCADVGHPARRQDIHIIQSKYIQDEFCKQSWIEEQNSISGCITKISIPSVFVTKQSTPLHLSQISFIKYIVLPTFELLHAPILHRCCTPIIDSDIKSTVSDKSNSSCKFALWMVNILNNMRYWSELDSS